MPTQVAIAILHQNNRVLLQLRDDDPAIVYPGQWGFFGGHLEPGEDPDAAVRRELLEEIGYVPPKLSFFKSYETEKAIRHVYGGPLTVPLTALVQNEGMDMGLVSLAEIREGIGYSTKLREMRSLAEPHRAILLEFWENRMSELSRTDEEL